MDDDDHTTLALFSDLDHFLLSHDHHCASTPAAGSNQDDSCCVSCVYGDLPEFQTLPETSPNLPPPPPPVYATNTGPTTDHHHHHAGAAACDDHHVNKREHHDKGVLSLRMVTIPDDGVEKDKEDRPKRKRTAEQHSVYERKRRNKIQERLRILQQMVPNTSKLTKSSILDETIKHIKGLQLHHQMMKEQGLGFLSQCMEMGKIQNQTQSGHHQYYPTCTPVSPPSGVGYAHEDGGSPKMPGTGVFPYNCYPPVEPILFHAADGSTLPPAVVTAELWAHISPSNHRHHLHQPPPPVQMVPAEVLAHVSQPSHHPALPWMVPVLRPVLNLGNQFREPIYHGPMVPPSVQQIPRTTAQEFWPVTVSVPAEKLGEASNSYVGNPRECGYNLEASHQTH